MKGLIRAFVQDRSTFEPPLERANITAALFRNCLLSIFLSILPVSFD